MSVFFDASSSALHAKRTRGRCVLHVQSPDTGQLSAVSAAFFQNLKKSLKLLREALGHSVVYFPWLCDASVRFYIFRRDNQPNTKIEPTDITSKQEQVQARPMSFNSYSHHGSFSRKNAILCAVLMTAAQTADAFVSVNKVAVAHSRGRL
jgi:hypothetical protein